MTNEELTQIARSSAYDALREGQIKQKQNKQMENNKKTNDSVLSALFTLQKYKIGVTTAIVLKALYHNKLNNKKLTVIANVSPARISLITDVLVKKDFVTRSHCFVDRRQVIHEITDKGREVIDAVWNETSHCQQPVPILYEVD